MDPQRTERSATDPGSLFRFYSLVRTHSCACLYCAFGEHAEARGTRWAIGGGPNMGLLSLFCLL